MRTSTLLVLSLLIFTDLLAQSEKEFYYDQARALLAQREIAEALIPLKKIYTAEPNNANINFLMGAAYTELPGFKEESVFHLKKAIQSVTTDYQVSSFKETKSPFYSFYYLSVALVELDKCAEAEKALEKFKSYGALTDKYYNREGSRHLQKCDYELYGNNFENWNKLIELPADYDPTFIPEEQAIAELEEKDSIRLASLKNRGLLTEKIEYTTSAPLYGVQIGSTNEIIPVNRFGNLKNIDAFVDKEGLIRYVVGHFSYRKQAESLLEVLMEKGYTDAFVVNVNDERKYSNSVVSFNNNNIRATLSGKIEFAVQLGAFEHEIPDELAKAYLQIEDLVEIKYGKLTLITTGTYDTYDAAKEKEFELHSEGFADAFVVAFNKGTKISLEEAKAATQ